MCIEQLKSKMETEGLTMYRVAKDLNVQWVTVRKWLNGASSPKGVYRAHLENYLNGKA